MVRAAKNNCSQDEFVPSALTKEYSTIPFLDSIYSGEALNRRCSEFDYFNTAALDLFMRPKDSCTKRLNNDVSISARKSVGFAAIDTLFSSPYDDGIDDSHHNDPGFRSSEECNESNYFENDDYIVRDLDNVRKVDKIVVKHATITEKISVTD